LIQVLLLAFLLHCLTNWTARMASTGVEPTKQYDVDIQQLKEKDTLHSEILVNKDLMTDAFQGEDSEHNQTLWQAVVSHKMACFWAFIMCFTMLVFVPFLEMLLRKAYCRHRGFKLIRLQCDGIV
jgi:hypothetical protein